MSTILFIRTEAFTPREAALFDLWSQILPGEVALLIDETSGVVETGDIPKRSYTWSDLAAAGLPDRPRGGALAHCADYLAAVIAPEMTSQDFALVVDAALLPRVQDAEAWRDLLSGLATADLALFGVSPAAKPLEGLYDQTLTSSPALFGFSAASAERLIARRIAIAADVLAGHHLHWPEAQVFLASEARALGLRVTDLAEALPAQTSGLDRLVPLRPEALPEGAPGNRLWFPVARDRGDYLARVGALLTARLAPERIAALLSPVLPLEAAEAKALSDLAWMRYGTPDITRFLPSEKPTLRIFLQAGAVDDQVGQIFDLWSRILPGQVTLVLPEGAAPETARPLLTHATSDLPQEAAMAAILPHLGAQDFAFLVQADAVPVVENAKAWVSLLEQCAEGDLALINLTHRGAGWLHGRGLEAIYQDAEIHGALGFLLGFTAQSATKLLARRAEVAGLGLSPATMTFLPTEALRLGLRVADLFKLAPRMGRGLSLNRPWWFPARPQLFAQNMLLHPVTSDRKAFLAGVSHMLRSKVAVPQIASHLDAILPLTNLERRSLQKTLDKLSPAPALSDLIPAPQDPGLPRRIRIFIRTHYMDDTIAELFDLWSQVLPGQVAILMDETSRVIDTGDLPKISFDLKALQRQGLPSRPEKRTAWFCGDYVMAALEPHLDPQDFALVVEGDAVPMLHDIQAWRETLARLSQGDIALTNFGLRQESWRWKRNLERLYTPDEVIGCLIVAFGFTRATANLLTRRRLAIAADLAAGRHDQWPHCEAFIATEAERLGLKITDFATELPGLRGEVSTFAPWWWDNRPADLGRNTILHPVTRDRAKFLQKIVVMLNRGDSPAEVSARIAAIGPLSPGETSLLDDMTRGAMEQPDFAAFLASGQ